MKFSNPQPDADSVSVKSMDVSSSKDTSSSTAIPLSQERSSTPLSKDGDEHEGNEENIMQRTKSISEQLSKVTFLNNL